jgi:hypothetical protein
VRGTHPPRSLCRFGCFGYNLGVKAHERAGDAEDRDDIARHEFEIERHESFNYALFDPGETELLGCVYIDPAEKPGTDAGNSWWVVDALVGGPIEAALDDLVPRWVASAWPLLRPRFVGRDLTWQA